MKNQFFVILSLLALLYDRMTFKATEITTKTTIEQMQIQNTIKLNLQRGNNKSLIINCMQTSM